MTVVAPPNLPADPDAAWAAYRDRVQRLKAAYSDIPPGQPVRLAKRTTNLFRSRVRTTGPGLDVAAFDGVIEVDAEARRADVQGMTTYEHLVDATLAHGLMPLVVPELKTITLGGAITGLGIESSSFRNGMPHESALEMDILTGDGRVVTARPEGEPHRSSRVFRTPTVPSATPCEPASNSSRCTPTSISATCHSGSFRPSSRPWRRSVPPGPMRAKRSRSSTAPSFPLTRATSRSVRGATTSRPSATTPDRRFTTAPFRAGARTG